MCGLSISLSIALLSIPIRKLSVCVAIVAVCWSVGSTSYVSAQLERLIADDQTSVYRWTSTCQSYLIVRGTHGLVIDLGDGSVLAHAESLGIEKIDYILFTSHHRERSQGFLQVDRSVTKLIGPEKEREFFERPESFRKWYPKLDDKFSVYGASYLRPPRLAIPLDRTLANEETLNWNGLEIRAVETPGNSPGGMTYLCQVDGQTIAFTGGLIHFGARMMNWFDSEWDYGFAKGIDVLQESVQRLETLQPQRLLPAYGPAIDQPAEELKTYLTKLKQYRAHYVRGYPVFDMTNRERDPVSVPTEVRGLSRVSEHVYKLSDAERGWNFALIISDRGHGLILDCGLLPGETLEEMIVGMRQHLGLKKIDAFWISHMHGDHFLLGPLLRERYGAESWTLDRVKDRIENPRHYDYAAMVSTYGDGFDGMPIDRAFRDGESFNWEGYQLQMDWMPGQTEFGCSLWLEIDGQKMVFTGDNLFGNPADPNQDGHEAVVARNSCILEEGYLHAANYLVQLDPDLIIGSHSYVMPNPSDFLQRYQRWAIEMIDIYKSLLPESHYQYRFDPYWVSAYPYRVELVDGDSGEVEITVRNFRQVPQRHRIVLETPPGVVAEPTVLEGVVDPESRQKFVVKLHANAAQEKTGTQIVAMDITLDDQRYGQWFDFLVRVGNEPKRGND